VTLKTLNFQNSQILSSHAYTLPIGPNTSVLITKIFLVVVNWASKMATTRIAYVLNHNNTFVKPIPSPMSKFGVKGMRYDFPKPSNIGVSGNPLRAMNETNIKLAKVLKTI